MKRNLFYVLPALILAGCAQDFDLAENAMVEPRKSEATSEPMTRALDGAVFNEVTGNWMIGLADPFALANVQAAYYKLAAGLSAQSLSKSEAAEFAAGKKLAPTHYTLKIYPKSEEEQSRVETMRDVNVAYQPFSYSQLTREEAAKVERSGNIRSATNTFAERSPYTVTHNYTDVTDGGPTGPVTYQLPILYTVWPASKPLPADLEYVMDYPVYLPEHPEAQAGKTTSLRSTSSSDVEIHLFREAVALSRGEDAAPARDENSTRAGGPPSSMWATVSGTLKNYDSVAQCDAPLANLSIGFQYGSLGSTTGIPTATDIMR
jgi:hypothetical protein